MIDYADAKAVADSMGERRDCAVKAVSLVCQVPYSVSHTLLADLGRKPRRGTDRQITLKAIDKLGFALNKLSFYTQYERFISKYAEPHKDVKSLTPGQVCRFPKAWQDGNTYLAFTNSHVFAIINGKVQDWTEGRAHRIKQIYVVIKKD